VDDGVVEGSDISIFYDPMIAKLITHGPTREAAIDAQITALDRFEIDGIGHNVDFLSALMQHPRFRAGELTTGFIAEEYPDGFHGAPVPDALTAKLAAVAGLIACGQATRANAIDGQLNGPAASPCEWVVSMDGAEHHVEITDDAVIVDGIALKVEAPFTPGQRLIEAVIDGEPLSLRLSRTRAGWRLTTRGRSHDLRLLQPHIAELAHHMIEKIPPDLSRFLLCPMPGLLTALNVKPGDKVVAGQPLAVVEAMKMENILRAEKAGTVKAVEAKPGDSLAVDAVILEFE
jgi:propionyl-CoA carboxylase alpha chain